MSPLKRSAFLEMAPGKAATQQTECLCLGWRMSQVLGCFFCGGAGGRPPCCYFPHRGRMWKGRLLLPWATSVAHLPHAGPWSNGSRRQPSTFPDISVMWGICFSLPSAGNRTAVTQGGNEWSQIPVFRRHIMYNILLPPPSVIRL